ncbi:MAG: hypothetical protein A3F72_01865 [Bacteroidetes bacterium RIFCSPLOWO2_12_FULL_35_15]|nr:MAG: hypothetical protein A3F72_01865 [Bacteroidetes bacterium RIFCSPLOWO2_12_FULL_35_15]
MWKKTKKNLHIALLFIITFLMSTTTYATKRYWVGTGTNTNWNTTANWAATSGGTNGSSVPVSTDSVYFDGGNDTTSTGKGQCSINAIVSIKRFEITSGYTDTVKQNSNTITVGTNGMILSGGVFWGGTANITDQGVFALTGCNFQSTSATLQIYGDYTFSSGTFLHNNGQVKFTYTKTITGNTTFYDVNFFPANSASSYTISSSTVLTSEHLLLISGGALVYLTGGTIDVKGDITDSNIYSNGGGNTNITINGSGEQTFNGSSSNYGYGWLPNIIINKPSGTLYLKGYISVYGNWTYTQGTVDASTYSSTVAFIPNSKTITGTQNLFNVCFAALGSVSFYVTLASGDTLTVEGTISYTGSGTTAINGGIKAKGDINLSGSVTGMQYTGTGSITLCGTGNQTITGRSTYNQGCMKNIIINKPSGFLFLNGLVSVYGYWNYIQGDIDDTTYNGELAFIYTGSIQGSHTLNKVTFWGYAITIAGGTVLTVPGTLSIIGTSAVTINTGTINATGDIILTNTSSTGGGTANININGNGNQILTGSSSINIGKLCNVTINKPSGTLILKNFVNVTGNWTYIQGTIDALTYNSTVVFPNNTNRSISGKHSLYNVTFYGNNTSTNSIPSTDTLTVEGELKTEGGFAISINTGVINAKGNITITNSSISGGGSGTIDICGAGNQTLTGSGLTGYGRLCNVKISKTSGTLTLADIISIAGSWQYNTGTVSAGNSTVVFPSGSSVSCQGLSSTMDFNNVTIYSGTVTLNGSLSVLGNSTINTSTTLNGNSKSIYVGGNWSNSGTFTSTNTIVTLNGATQSITKAGGETFNNLTISGTGTKTAANNLTVNGALTIDNVATLDMQTYQLLGSSITSSGTGTLKTASTNSAAIPTGKTWTPTVEYAGTSAASTIQTGTYNNLVISGSRGTSSITFPSATVSISGALTNSATFTSGDFITNGNTIDYNGTVPQTIAPFNYKNLTISGARTSNNVTLSNTGTIGISGTLTYSPTYSTGSLINTGSTIDYNGTGAQTVLALNYNNLTISGAHTSNNVTLSNTGTLGISGVFTNSATFTTGGIIATGISVGLDGSSNQHLSSGIFSGIKNLTINKSSGFVVLDTIVTIDSTLNLTKGRIISSSSNILVLNNGATVIGGSGNSYISGPIKKIGNSAFTFPIGDTLLPDSSAYHPLTITAPSTATDAYTAQYTAANQTFGDSLQVDSLESISACEYFDLTRNAGTSVVIPTISWNTNSCNVETYDNLRVAYWDSGNTQWETLGAGTTTVNDLRGTVSGSFGISASQIHFVIGRTRSNSSCAIVKRELDGGYHIVYDGNLSFKYDEEYNDLDGKLKFNIYNSHNTIVASNSTMLPTSAQPLVSYGDNRIKLNIASCTFTPTGNLGSGFYILEVINEKNEKWYLRFKHVLSISGLCAMEATYWER